MAALETHHPHPHEKKIVVLMGKPRDVKNIFEPSPKMFSMHLPQPLWYTKTEPPLSFLLQHLANQNRTQAVRGSRNLHCTSQPQQSRSSWPKNTTRRDDQISITACEFPAVLW